MPPRIKSPSTAAKPTRLHAAWPTVSALLLAVGAAGAQTPVPDAYFTVVPITDQVDIAPGATGTLQFDVQMGTEGGTARFVIWTEGAAHRQRLLSQYTFTPRQPGICGPARETTSYDSSEALTRIEFPIMPLAARATVRCSYEVRRQASSTESFSLSYYHHLPTNLDPSNREHNYPYFVRHYGILIGSLTDLSVHAAPEVGTESGDGLYRLSIRNLGTYNVVSSSSIQSSCQPTQPELSVIYETGFPGGCPMRELSCDMFPRPPRTTQRSVFDLGAVGAGQGQSCLVRIRNRGAASQVYFDLYSINPESRQIDAASIDRNPGNDRTTLQLPAHSAFSAQQSPAPTAVPVGKWLVPILLLLFAATARARLRHAIRTPLC